MFISNGMKISQLNYRTPTVYHEEMEKLCILLARNLQPIRESNGAPRAGMGGWGLGLPNNVH